jgi:glutathione S-transferase
MSDSDERLRLHGLDLSYFTGKLEAYCRAKGLAYDFVAMDMADFRRCAKATGRAQMPVLEFPGGRMLTDTTAIIAQCEDQGFEPALRPADPAAAFLSRLYEDMFDEWLWRPALYYRWAFKPDADLRSRQIAETMLRDLPLPLWLRRLFIRRRQKKLYLELDGVTKSTAPQIEKLYADVLDALEPVFSARPFLFGERPCEADFGLFGPMFRHFYEDPTPRAIMEERGRASLGWIERMWSAKPTDFEKAAPLGEAPGDLAWFDQLAATQYLPYLEANSLAVSQGRSWTSWRLAGVDWLVPPSAYRQECLNTLRRDFADLPDAARETIAARLGEVGHVLLGGPVRQPQNVQRSNAPKGPRD